MGLLSLAHSDTIQRFTISSINPATDHQNNDKTKTERSNISETAHRLGRAGDVVQVLLDVGVVDLAQVARVSDTQDGVGAPEVLANETQILRVLTN